MTTPVDLPVVPPGTRPPGAVRSIFVTDRPRPIRTARRPLTASAARIDLTATAPAKRRRDTWQEHAWGYRDEVGEIRYATTFLANVASRMRLYAAVATAEGDDPVPVTDAVADGTLPPQIAADAQALVESLAAGRVHAGKLLGAFAEQMEIVGEAMLVGRLLADGAERWQVYSTDEVKHDDTGWYLATDATAGGAAGGQDIAERLDPDTSYVARVWRPHPRHSHRADSPMRALLDVAEELLVVGRAIRTETRSRVHAGILYVHGDVVNAARINTEVEDTAGPPPLIDDIATSMTAAAGDEASPETLVPTILTGSVPFAEAIGHVSMARTIDTSLIERQKAALMRLGMGLDVPPELITGMADVNHWTAWQVDDSTFRNHVEPLVQLMVDALTVSMFREGLLELGHAVEQVERLIIWYDPADAVTAPNRGAEADAAYDRRAISDAAYRTARGFDDGDAPSDEERLLRMVLERGPLDPTSTVAVLTALLGRAGAAIPAAPAEAPEQPALPAPDPAAPEETPAVPGPAEAPGEPAAVVASAADDRAARLSRQLADVDRQLRDRLHGAADAALARALERTGSAVRAAASRRDRALYASLSGVPAEQVPATVGPAAVTAAGVDVQQVITEALATLSGQWTAWVGAAGTQVVDLVAELAGWRDDDPRRASLAAALAGGTVAGWAWLSQRLTDLATSLLYNPADPDAAPQDRGVPYSIVRGAVAVAGGLDPAAGGVTDRGLPGRQGRPLGGLAYGAHATDALAASGVQDAGYEWVYGVSSNPFQPHRRMDGVRFASFDSPELAPPAGFDWLGPIMLPGDHDGCRCSYNVLYSVPGAEPVSPEQEAQVAALPPEALSRLRAQATADVAAGRTDTDVVRQVMEAERQANARPSQPASPTPVTDAVQRQQRSRP